MAANKGLREAIRDIEALARALNHAVSRAQSTEGASEYHAELMLAKGTSFDVATMMQTISKKESRESAS